MRTISLKLLSALFLVAIFAGCSSSSSTGDGDSSGSSGSGTQTSGSDRGSVYDDGSMSAGDLSNIVYFDFDRSEIRPEARGILMRQAKRLKGSGEKVTLEGHADERGTREYNMALGERRAKAVRDFLVLQGVSRTQVDVVSYGEERLASDYHAKNRRVEIVNR